MEPGKPFFIRGIAYVLAGTFVAPVLCRVVTEGHVRLEPVGTFWKAWDPLEVLLEASADAARQGAFPEDTSKS